MEDKHKNDQNEASEAIELAGIMPRLGASILDGVLLAIVLSVALAILSQLGDSFQLIQVAGLAVPVGYHWYFWTRRNGQTPGKFALGIRVIKTDGSELSDTDALIRAIGYNVSALLCGLGFIWAIFDQNNQTWHDKLASTYVVRKEGQRNTVSIGT